MKIISWNINGLQNIFQKTIEGAKTLDRNQSSLLQLIQNETPDILCLQEVRCSTIEKYATELKEHYPWMYTNCATKKGYSGTMILSTSKPSKVVMDFGDVNKDLSHTSEGRMITVVYPTFILVNVYTPNSKQELERLTYRTQEWEPLFRKYIESLQRHQKPLIICGDLNVAHNPLDIHNPRANKRKAGFTDEERAEFTRLLSQREMTDTFRMLHPSTVKYTYWSNFAQSRQRNKGWRIDYFLVGTHDMKHVTMSDILTQYWGSDHAPIVLCMTQS